MAGSQKCGCLGTDTNSPEIDSGTLAKTLSPKPEAICGSTLPRSGTTSTWGLWQILKWKVLPTWLGGDPKILRKYKDAWVISQKETISELSMKHGLPPVLLAGVAWIEVGGDPGWIDDLAYSVRAFDHSADPKLEPLTITKKPEMTSMGNVSIQLRRAAQTVGLDFATMNADQRKQLIECLSSDETNLEIVAKHLVQLKNIDFRNTSAPSDDLIRVVGSRYNRGPDLPIAKIRQNTSYGDFILKNRSHLLNLLK